MSITVIQGTTPANTGQLATTASVTLTSASLANLSLIPSGSFILNGYNIVTTGPTASANTSTTIFVSTGSNFQNTLANIRDAVNATASAANRVDVGQGTGNATNYLIFTPQFNAGGANPSAVTQSGNVTYNPSTLEFRAGLVNNTSVAQRTLNVDSNLTIDASVTQSMTWTAAFTATRSLIVNNLENGRQVDIYIRNTNATQRQIIFSGSTTTTGHTPINMAASAGGVSVTTQNIAGSTGTMYVIIKNINGTFTGGIM